MIGTYIFIIWVLIGLVVSISEMRSTTSNQRELDKIDVLVFFVIIFLWTIPVIEWICKYVQKRIKPFRIKNPFYKDIMRVK